MSISVLLYRMAIAVFLLFTGSASFSASSTVFADRIDFDRVVQSQIIDSYSASTYGWSSNGYAVLTDAAMSSAFAETTYRVTFPRPFPSNLVGTVYLFDTDGAYCAGCNGSFELGFSKTSVSNSGGVFGVGLDIDYSVGNPLYAFVTFGDGSHRDYLLPTTVAGGPNLFWGISSAIGIQTIHFGDISGTYTDNSSLVIDNLTIGVAAVPEPETSALMIAGLVCVGAVIQRRKVKREFCSLDRS